MVYLQLCKALALPCCLADWMSSLHPNPSSIIQSHRFAAPNDPSPSDTARQLWWRNPPKLPLTCFSTSLFDSSKSKSKSTQDMPHAALTIQHAAAMTRFAAKQLTKCALPYGAIGVRSAVYFLSMFLTMFMNNSATVAPRPNWSQHPQN